MTAHVSVLLLLASFFARPASAEPVRQPQIEVELVARNQTVKAGESFQTALVLRPDPEWHVYWRNPGDSGLPPKIEWTLPPGFTAGPLLFTAPDRIPYHTLVNFGYPSEALFLTDVKAPAGLQPGQEVVIKGKAKWLVCKEECIPGKAELTLKLKVIAADQAEVPDATWEPRIEQAAMKLPREHALGAGVRMELQTVREKESGALWLRFQLMPQDGQPAIERAEFFFDGNDFEPSTPQYLRNTGGKTELLLARKKPDGGIGSEKGKQVTGITVLRSTGPGAASATRAFEVSTKLGEPLQTLARTQLLQGAFEQKPTAPKHQTSSTADPSLLLMLGFAFIGGLILNLMPCVFPVLSIKILGFVQQASQKPEEIRRHGWVFTLGVMVSFWILAAILVVFRQAGVQVGWGFQLQSPAFVAALALLFFLMSLNLMGTFEIGGRLMGAGNALAGRQGLSGTFFSGVLTVIAATPCSAPFMATALGFALSQPAWVGVLVLTVLGAGLATPYLILSLQPALLKRLPRPGVWMETFKQALAFPLLVTSLWLLSVLGAQSGIGGITRALLAFIGVYFLIWLFGRTRKTVRSRLGWIITALALFALWIQQEGWRFDHDDTREATAAAPTPGSTGGQGSASPNRKRWRKFTPAAVEEARHAGKAVFVDFTADWCVTCKVNERLVLNTRIVQEAFQKYGVETFQADWTNADPMITAALAAVNRNSVPVYLWYAPNAAEPEILPQLLSAGGLISRAEKTGTQ